MLLASGCSGYRILQSLPPHGRSVKMQFHELKVEADSFPPMWNTRRPYSHDGRPGFSTGTAGMGIEALHLTESQ